jgi:hypothetical protein
MFGWFAHSSTSPSRSGRARLRLEPLEDRTVPSADPLEPPPSDPPPPTEPTVAPPAEPPSAPALEVPLWDSWTEADWEAFWLDFYDNTAWAAGDSPEEYGSEFADGEEQTNEAAPALTPPAWFNDPKLYSATAEGVTLQKWAELFGADHATTLNVFDTLDTNGDSKITLTELEAASAGTEAQKSAVANTNWAYAKVTTTMLDHNRIALLREPELVPEGATGITEARWQAVFGDSTEMVNYFGALDANADGTITHADIIALGSTGRTADYETIWTAELAAGLNGLGAVAQPEQPALADGAATFPHMNSLRAIQLWQGILPGNRFVKSVVNGAQYLANAPYRELVDDYASHVQKLEAAVLPADEWADWKREKARITEAMRVRLADSVNGSDRFVVGFTGADGKDHVLGTTSSYGKREIEDMMRALNRSPAAVRALATLSALGNVAQSGLGVLMLSGSKATFGASAVPGWFVFTRGVEGAVTDAASIVSGEVQLRPSIIAVREVARAFMSTKDAEHVALGVDLALSIADLILARRANLPASPGATGPAFQLATSAGSTQRVGLKQVSSIAIDARAADRLKELMGAGKIAGAGNIWFMAVARDSTDPTETPPTGGGGGASGTPPTNPPAPVAAATGFAHMHAGWLQYIDSVIDTLIASGRPKTIVLGEGGQGSIRSFVNREPSKMTEFLEMRPNSLDYSAHRKAGTFTAAMDAETLEFNLLLIERLHEKGFTFKVLRAESSSAANSPWLKAELQVLERLGVQWDVISQARIDEVMKLAKWR